VLPVRAELEAPTSTRPVFMVPVNMAKPIRGTKKSRGRPKTTGSGVQIGMRWQQSDLDRIDAWATGQHDSPSRAEAIRRLVDIALERKR